MVWWPPGQASDTRIGTVPSATTADGDARTAGVGDVEITPSAPRSTVSTSASQSKRRPSRAHTRVARRPTYSMRSTSVLVSTIPPAARSASTIDRAIARIPPTGKYTPSEVSMCAMAAYTPSASGGGEARVQGLEGEHPREVRVA